MVPMWKKRIIKSRRLLNLFCESLSLCRKVVAAAVSAARRMIAGVAPPQAFDTNASTAARARAAQTAIQGLTCFQPRV
jgi:hypothetical protein